VSGFIARWYFEWRQLDGLLQASLMLEMVFAAAAAAEVAVATAFSTLVAVAITPVA
jgi:hypothetical protein